MQFGRMVSDAPASSNTGEPRELYIRTFRDSQTKITFLWDDPEHEIYEHRQHWDHKHQVSIPCALGVEGAKGCIGHEYAVEDETLTDDWIKENWVTDEFTFLSARDRRAKKDYGWSVRQTSRKFIFPAVDDKGYANIFQVGPVFRTSLMGIYTALGTITDQQFIVICSDPGKLSNTVSFLPTGKAAQISNFAVPDKEAIDRAVGDKYAYAYEKFLELGLINEAGKPEPDLPDDAPLEQTPAVEGFDPNLSPSGATNEALKYWLDNHPDGKIDYAPRAPRSTLQALVKKTQEPPF